MKTIKIANQKYKVLKYQENSRTRFVTNLKENVIALFIVVVSMLSIPFFFIEICS